MKFKSAIAGLVAASMLAAGSAGFCQGKKVELELFESKPEVVGVMEKIIAKFSAENPGIKINLTSSSDGRTVLQTRLSANEMPDILNSFPAETFYKTMFREGLMVDLSGKSFLSKVDPTVLKMSACDGKYYAVPMTISTYGIYYNKDIFEKHGVKAPQTYAELVAVCKKLSARGVVPFTLANKDLGIVAQTFERLSGVINNDNDAEFRKIAKGDMRVQDSPTLNAYADMLAEILKYCSKDSVGIDNDSSKADFSNGQVAMTIIGTWGLSTFKKNNPNIRCELIPFPNPTGKPTKIPVNIDTSFSVCASCKHQAEALKFIEFLCRPDIAQMYCDVDGNPNLVKGVKYGIVEHAKMSEAIAKGNTYLTVVNFWPNSFREEMRNPLQQFILDGNKANFLAAAGVAINKKYNN